MKDKIVMITGASAGIGYATALAFAQLGARLVITGRRLAPLEALAERIRKTAAVAVMPLAFDVANNHAVDQAWRSLPDTWQGVDVLINNAGMALGLDRVVDGMIDQWHQVIDVNIKGVLHLVRAVLPGMIERQRGHLIQLGSISAHEVYPGGSVYCATKFAVKALSQGLKMEVHGTPVRVTQIDPGMVETEFSLRRFGGDHERAKAVYQGMNSLQAADVADAIVYCATRPAHVNIPEMKIYPTDQTTQQMVVRRDS